MRATLLQVLGRTTFAATKTDLSSSTALAGEVRARAPLTKHESPLELFATRGCPMIQDTRVPFDP